MRARSRFHGYRPAMGRRSTTLILESDKDDYTTSLNITPGKMFGNPTKLKGATEEMPQAIRTGASLERAARIRSRRVMRRNRRQRRGSETSTSDESEHSFDRNALHETSQMIHDHDIYSASTSDSEDGSSTTTYSIDEDAQKYDDVDASFSEESVGYGDIVEPVVPTDSNIDMKKAASFQTFRITYLIVTVAIMLADGLQGTHLYVLYEGYGYSVASLYCLGFVTGAVTSPVTGPMVDKLGRKKAALLYCFLEIIINQLEQYPNIYGLIVSRMVGGITTNLLQSVFETWLDTEHRRRGFNDDQYETIMRDTVVASNMAAIASGCLAHVLAENFGNVGPFQGAVTCTAIALVVVFLLWTENYGSVSSEISSSMFGYMGEAVKTFKSDSRVLRVGIIQGLTEGSLQIFIFMWSPALRHFSMNAQSGGWFLDSHGEPAYGLIFGGYMAVGVLGGLVSPAVRKLVTSLVSTPVLRTAPGTGEVKPLAVEMMAAFCYIICAILLMTPSMLPENGPHSFTLALTAFLIYEFVASVYGPCEGMIRSIYIPSSARCSIMTLPRIIVNVAVASGVISTTFVSFNVAFTAIAGLMIISAALQMSLVSKGEWKCLWKSVMGEKIRPSKRVSIRSYNHFMSAVAETNRRLSSFRCLPSFSSFNEELEEAETEEKQKVQ